MCAGQRNLPRAGEDALLSIVQMPAGVPVATVAIDNATNAGILAAQMLSTGDADAASSACAPTSDGLEAIVIETRSERLSQRRRLSKRRIVGNRSDPFDGPGNKKRLRLRKGFGRSVIQSSALSALRSQVTAPVEMSYMAPIELESCPARFQLNSAPDSGFTDVRHASASTLTFSDCRRMCGTSHRRSPLGVHAPAHDYARPDWMSASSCRQVAQLRRPAQAPLHGAAGCVAHDHQQPGCFSADRRIRSCRSCSCDSTLPATRPTKMSPMPWSNTISGGTRESRQD